MKKTITKIRSRLKNSITISKENTTRFFKVEKGDYAEFDEFIGVTVPTLRMLAKKEFADISLDIISELLTSKINEERLLALIILVANYNKSNQKNKKEIYDFYLNHIQYINNWNLVDASAHYIIGSYLYYYDKNKNLLLNLAGSEIIWHRRIAIVSTWYFIKNNDLDWTFKLAKLLLNDSHDLIHKSVGWMLREAGKQDQKKLLEFLDEYYAVMPRTMLRYSIEKLEPKRRQSYLNLDL